MAKYLLEAPDDDMERWKQEARADGISFAEWIRRKLAAASPARTGRIEQVRMTAREYQRRFSPDFKKGQK